MNIDTIVNRIDSGQMTHMYERWKEHPNRQVRAALARNGYFPDTYIKDKNSYVRFEVLNQHPEYLIELFKKLDDRVKAYYELTQKADATKEEIEAGLKCREPGNAYKTALKLKLQTRMTQPLVLEKNMSLAQLYLIGSPFWTLPFNARQVELISRMGKINSKYKNELGDILNPKLNNLELRRRVNELKRKQDCEN